LTASVPELWGCDFSSAPSRRKPIVLARGGLRAGRVLLERLETFETLNGFGQRLAEPGHWVGGFDLPFGLPRELVEQLGWPTDWLACMRHYAALSRAEIRECFAAFCAARPAGGKFAHRATDRPAGSSPSMKWVNPPVAYMLHAGLPLLLEAGVSLPGLCSGDEARVALEAYPGLLARSVLGARSYKSDDKAKQTPERLIARKDLLHALEQGTAPLLQAPACGSSSAMPSMTNWWRTPAATGSMRCCACCRRPGRSRSSRAAMRATACRTSIRSRAGSSRLEGWSARQPLPPSAW